MKVCRLEISNRKEFEVLIAIREILNFFDIGLVIVNTNLFTISDLEKYLKYEEIKRLDTYKTEVSKMNFAISRSIVNKVFGTVLEIPIRDIVVLRDKRNKPYIKNKNNIKFNISHTDGCVVVGFSKKEIGVDVEKVKYDFDFECILDSCFNPMEIKNIGLDAQMFFRYWIAKEAYLKYEGIGLVRNLKELKVIYVDEQTIKIEDNVKRVYKELLILASSPAKYYVAICT